MIDKSSEQHRFRCETRHCLALGLRARTALDDYLKLVAKHRGPPEAEKLRTEARDQYAKGSRGAFGVWK